MQEERATERQGVSTSAQQQPCQADASPIVIRNEQGPTHTHIEQHLTAEVERVILRKRGRRCASGRAAEIELAVRELRLGRTTGTDGVSAECWKAATEFYPRLAAGFAWMLNLMGDSGIAWWRHSVSGSDGRGLRVRARA